MNRYFIAIAMMAVLAVELSEEAFDRVCAINLRGTIMACKHVLPIMRLQRSGALINISSVAARRRYREDMKDH
jgi:NAD(P)-dependent dehydrogenase (short-subunit alcohol dehydrogenase family)